MDLTDAKITEDISMTGASFDGTLDANSSQLQSDGQNKASFKNVDLTKAKITEDISMTGASFDGTLDADARHRHSAPAKNRRR